MTLDTDIQTRIRSIVDESDVLLFMKGNREAPQCGFSATVIQILDRFVPDYATFDVLGDQAVREGVKEFSSWPTIPQLYVRGEFLGGCDIVQELYATGELASALGIELGDVAVPAITITDAAAEALRQALAEADPALALHLAVDARWNAKLLLGPEEAGELAVEANGIGLRLDALSASRSEGASIDLTRIGKRTGFQVHLPSAPAQA